MTVRGQKFNHQGHNIMQRFFIRSVRTW